MFAVLGPTYQIRFYLTLCGCSWNGRYWQTQDENLKERLRKQGLSEQSLRKIRLEKILKKAVDKD